MISPYDKEMRYHAFHRANHAFDLLKQVAVSLSYNNLDEPIDPAASEALTAILELRASIMRGINPWKYESIDPLGD